MAAPEHLRAAEHEEVSEILRIKTAINEVQGLMAQEQKDFVDISAATEEEKDLMDVELEAEEIFEECKYLLGMRKEGKHRRLSKS